MAFSKLPLCLVSVSVAAGFFYRFWTMLSIFGVFIITIHLVISRKFDYWKHRNVNFIQPRPFFGNALELLCLKKSIGDVTRDLYESTTKSMIGFFILDKPCLLIRDPQIIKHILIKDFAIFNNRGIAENIRDDPIGSHLLFNIRNPDWKGLRKAVSPAFSSGKIKLMYKLIEDVGEQMISFIKQEVAKNSTMDIRELSSKFTTNSITSTSFGLNANAFFDNKSGFVKMAGKSLNWAHFERAFSTTCYFLFSPLVKLLRLKFVDETSATFMRQCFWETVSEREEKKFTRNDLIDILIDMKKMHQAGEYVLEGDVLVAQAVQFFLAGFETSSHIISCTLHELAFNENIQETVRTEILEKRNKYGEISYEALQEMKYLDQCVKESLRKYPPLQFLDRTCNAEYKIPGTDVVITKGTGVYISTWGMQMDPQYYQNPEEYVPRRFDEEMFDQKLQYTYLPFGEGPRNCLGSRYGTIVVKSAIAFIIAHYKVKFSDKTTHPIVLDHKGFLMAPVGAMPLNFTPYENQ